MRRLPTLLALLAVMAVTASAQPYWNSLKTYRTGALLPHDRIVPAGDWSRCLNGTWAFRYFESPAKAAKFNMTADRYRDSIRVPGNIELQGFGVPVYVNMKNEFPSHPPYAPTDYNPVGIYACDFTVPAHWRGRRTVVKFGAVASAMYLYVNGREVGYSEDSKTPHEWDISRYLRAGRNRLSVKVLRWCDGSYLECQDMWRMSGITRDVTLYSVPRVYISDVRVVADLDTVAYRTGRLDVLVDISERVEGGAVAVELRDLRTDSLLYAGNQVLSPRDWFANLMADVPDVEAWSDSTPTLYQLTVSLLDTLGTVTETLVKRIGFRHLDIKNGQLRLNGRPMEIRGVNRHEHSVTGGHYVTPDEMRLDVALMKQMGINAVRTSHYPNDELWYDLCDSAGIYLWDEANLESHAQGYGDEALPKQPEWKEPMLDRVYNMYRRDRNHPSVIAWSLGNECGNGICMEEAYRLLKEYDPTRPVTYERAELDANTDIVEVMYPSVQFLSEYARNPRNTRPYIIAEYCHAMGNSMGGLQDYWDTIDKYPQLQGGFIWDWVDQAFRVERGSRRTAGGKPRIVTEPTLSATDPSTLSWAAGGDLGALPGLDDDDAFCANGILAADRTPHPCAAEVEAVYTRGRNCVRVEEPRERRRRARLARAATGPAPSATAPLTLHGGDARVVLDPTNGHITSYTLAGREMLAAPLRPNFWRPPTENDLVDRNGARAWEGLDQLQTEVIALSVNDNEARMLLHLLTPSGSRLRVKQIAELDSLGCLQLSYLVAPDGHFRTLPKLGLQFGVDTAYVAAAFYGNLYETYPDRRAAYRVGRWYKSLDSLAAPQYVVPEEQGNREARWVRLCPDRPDVLPPLTVISPDTVLNFSIRRYNDTLLTAARRWHDLRPDAYYTVSIDHRVAPLGTATCGPGAADRFCISGDSVYTYRFVFIPGTTNRQHGFKPHPDLQRMPAAETVSARLAATVLSCTQLPARQYGEGFPASLVDSRRAVAGDYSRGWTGFSAPDTVEVLLALDRRQRLDSIVAGVCHSPSDWVLMPRAVEVRWSPDGSRWSPWRTMDLRYPPADVRKSSRRLVYSLGHLATRKMRFVMLRFLCQPTLPDWHPYAGQPSWLMVDELELR